MTTEKSNPALDRLIRESYHAGFQDGLSTAINYTVSLSSLDSELHMETLLEILKRLKEATLASYENRKKTHENANAPSS